MKEVLKKYKVVWIAILFSLFVEIFVCNYGFWRTLMVGNPIDEVAYTKVEQENVIKIENLDQRVTSINFRYEKPLTKHTTYQIKIVTQERHLPVTLNEKTISPKDTQFILLDTHSNCKSIEIRIEGEGIELEIIQINQPIFHFNIIRAILLFLGAIVFLKIKGESLGQNEYDENSKKQKRWDIAVLAILCIAMSAYTIAQIAPHKILLSPKEMEVMGIERK